VIDEVEEKQSPFLYGKFVGTKMIVFFFSCFGEEEEEEDGVYPPLSNCFKT